MIPLESHEKSALARLYGTPAMEFLERRLAKMDKLLRWQPDPAQKTVLQGRAQELEDLLGAIRDSAGRNEL